MIFVVLSLGLPAVSLADQPGSGVKAVKAMSEAEQTNLALSAAPAHIAKDAGVMIYGTDGKLTQIRPSSNGFTCIPTVMNLPDPDPMCMDHAVNQWMTDLINNAAKPSNTVPGIAYMARGGSHFEKKVVMQAEEATIVQEPPHWIHSGTDLEPPL